MSGSMADEVPASDSPATRHQVRRWLMRQTPGFDRLVLGTNVDINNAQLRCNDADAED